MASQWLAVDDYINTIDDAPPNQTVSKAGKRVSECTVFTAAVHLTRSKADMRQSRCGPETWPRRMR